MSIFNSLPPLAKIALAALIIGILSHILGALRAYIRRAEAFKRKEAAQ